MFTGQGIYELSRIHMETFGDLLHRADEKRVKLLAQEMHKEWIRTLYDASLRKTLQIAGELCVAVGLILLFRS